MLIHIAEAQNHQSEMVIDLISIMIFIIILIIVIFKPFKKRPTILKQILIGIISTKVLKLCFQFWLFYHNNNIHRREQTLIECVVSQSLIGLFMNIVGIFYLREQMVFNLTNLTLCVIGLYFFSYQENMHHILIVIISCLFNLIDGYFHSK